MAVATLASPVQYCATAHEAISALTPWLEHKPRALGYDLETTGLDPLRGFPLLVQLSDGSTSIVIPIFHAPEVLPTLQLLLTDPAIRKIAHNAKFEYQWTKVHFGVAIANLWDTQTADLILRCGLFEIKSLHEHASLKECAKRYLRRDLDKTQQTSFIDQDPTTFCPTAEQIAYAAEDARIELPLARELERQLSQAELQDTMALEMAVLPVIAEMELNGVYVDQELWEQLLVEIRQEADRRAVSLRGALSAPLIRVVAQRRAQQHAVRAAWDTRFKAFSDDLEAQTAVGEETVEGMHVFPALKERRQWIQAQQREWKERDPRPAMPEKMPELINLASPPQIHMALQELGITLPNLQFSTIKEAVDHFPQQRELLSLYVEWKAFFKLESAFGETILARIDPQGRLHATINQLVSTGRMSVAKPGLATIPKGERMRGASDEFAARFRTCFVAPPGRKLICADYSSIEFRELAELAGEESVIEAIRRGDDPHEGAWRDMQEIITGRRPAQVAKGERTTAKIINYGVAYGFSEYGMSKNLGVTEEDARAFLEAWRAARPKMWTLLTRYGQDAQQRGETRTLLGRRRLYDRPAKPAPGDYLGRREYDKRMSGIKRAGMNAPIQGLNADIAKSALVRIQDELRVQGLDAFVVLYVYDEIVTEAAAAQADRVAQIVRACMIQAGEAFLEKVPVEVEVKVGDVWSH